MSVRTLLPCLWIWDWREPNCDCIHDFLGWRFLSRKNQRYWLKLNLYFFKGKIRFTTSNYHKNLFFNFQLRNQITTAIQFLKPGKSSPLCGFEDGFHFMRIKILKFKQKNYKFSIKNTKWVSKVFLKGKLSIGTTLINYSDSIFMFIIFGCL